MSDKPVADSDNILASKSKTNLCRERLAGEDVDDRKNPNPSPIDQLICHKIHRPRLVGSSRYVTLAATHQHFSPPWPLAA
jgi:hypothetical protein